MGQIEEEGSGGLPTRSVFVESSRTGNVSERESHVCGVVLDDRVRSACREEACVAFVGFCQIANAPGVHGEGALRDRIGFGDAGEPRELSGRGRFGFYGPRCRDDRVRSEPGHRCTRPLEHWLEREPKDCGCHEGGASRAASAARDCDAEKSKRDPRQAFAERRGKEHEDTQEQDPRELRGSWDQAVAQVVRRLRRDQECTQRQEGEGPKEKGEGNAMERCGSPPKGRLEMTVETEERAKGRASRSACIPLLPPASLGKRSPSQGKRWSQVHSTLGAKQRGTGIVVRKQRPSGRVETADPELPRHRSGAPDALENAKTRREPDLVNRGEGYPGDLWHRFGGGGLALCQSI
jgi:hypothetical protein